MYFHEEHYINQQSQIIVCKACSALLGTGQVKQTGKQTFKDTIGFNIKTLYYLRGLKLFLTTLTVRHRSVHFDTTLRASETFESLKRNFLGANPAPENKVLTHRHEQSL